MLRKTIGRILPDTAAERPDSTAPVFGEKSFTFAGLDRQDPAP